MTTFGTGFDSGCGFGSDSGSGFGFGSGSGFGFGSDSGFGSGIVAIVPILFLMILDLTGFINLSKGPMLLLCIKSLYLILNCIESIIALNQ